MAESTDVGLSSYGELKGVMQRVTSPEVAAQVNSLIYESRGVFAGGAVLSVNEGVRPRWSQAQKLAEYEAYLAGGPWAPMAASPLYTSPHDESKGNALDFGVTMPDGSNRALTFSEHSWVVARGEQRGIIWTGRDFRPVKEEWHFNGGYPATIPPIDPEEFDMTPNEKKQLAAVLDAVNKTKTAQGRIEIRQVLILDAANKIKVAVGGIATGVASLVKSLVK